MTYYEEFGIPSSATPDEIRQAHRRLVKILHPDLQPEKVPRQLAEIQTRRINGIAQILLDPIQRQGYETGLLNQANPPRRKLFRSAPGLALTGICILAGLWFLQFGLLQLGLTQLNPPPAIPQPSSVAIAHPEISTHQPGSAIASSPRKTVSEPSALPGRTTPSIDRALLANREPTTQEPLGDRRESWKQEPDINRRPHPEPVVEPSQVVERKSLASQGAPDAHNPLVGTWIYVPAPVAEEDKKVYRPEYIEMRIRDVRGVLEGQYRARYYVPDRPLSPNVGFHFAGQPGAGSAAFRWNGSNGIAGQVELKLMTANSIQVDWRVTELAESADLVSGTAILTRVQ